MTITALLTLFLCEALEEVFLFEALREDLLVNKRLLPLPLDVVVADELEGPSAVISLALLHEFLLDQRLVADVVAKCFADKIHHRCGPCLFVKNLFI